MERIRKMKQDCILKSPNCFSLHGAFGGRIFPRVQRKYVCKWLSIRVQIHNTRRDIYIYICIYRTTSFFSVKRNILLRAPGYRRSDFNGILVSRSIAARVFDPDIVLLSLSFARFFVCFKYIPFSL